MTALFKRLLVVPPGIRALFEAAAAGAIPIYEIREIDPTHPGLDEFVAALRGEDGEGEGSFDEGGNFHQKNHRPSHDPAHKTRSGAGFLRLICLDGRRLDP